MAVVSLLAVGLVVAATTAPEVGASRYWKDCGQTLSYQPITTIVHRVPCQKAHRVMHRSYSKGQTSTNGYVRVKSFTCHIRPNAYRMVECRRGSHVILGPLPS